MPVDERFEALRKDWKPPRELSRALPREVELTGAGIFLVVLAFLMFGGAVAAYLAIHNTAVKQAQRLALLDQQGVDTEATITRLWRRNDKERQPMVTYGFQLDGRFYEASTPAPMRIWRELRERTPLPVRYVPSDPAVSHPRDWNMKTTPAWLPVTIALLLAGVGGLILYILGRQKRLLSEGRPAPGIVTRELRGQHGRVAQYEFSAGSKVLRGRSKVRRGAPKVGDTVCVIYDPERPRRNEMFPMELVKLR
jgi:hypothetical protein